MSHRAYAPQPNWSVKRTPTKATAFVGAHHSLRSFRRRLPWALNDRFLEVAMSARGRMQKLAIGTFGFRYGRKADMTCSQS